MRPEVPDYLGEKMAIGWTAKGAGLRGGLLANRRARARPN